MEIDIFSSGWKLFLVSIWGFGWVLKLEWCQNFSPCDLCFYPTGTTDCKSQSQLEGVDFEHKVGIFGAILVSISPGLNQDPDGEVQNDVCLLNLPQMTCFRHHFFVKTFFKCRDFTKKYWQKNIHTMKKLKIALFKNS